LPLLMTADWSCLATGSLFALWRIELLPAPWSVAIWPLLASMFMFRIALYLYALKYDARRPSLSRTLAYFFMLPNVCFPLFPVVDYSTFARNYYDRESRLIYHSGMKWIARGLVHLVLYRLVYLHGVSDPTLVETVGQLVQFLVATFLLYLRVSGQFHLIIGVLHLFGFRLPDTHHLYFLASGFTDFWRRINIYWKDFAMKLCTTPASSACAAGAHHRWSHYGHRVPGDLLLHLQWFIARFRWSPGRAFWGPPALVDRIAARDEVPATRSVAARRGARRSRFDGRHSLRSASDAGEPVGDRLADDVDGCAT
jgi:hypothetical protein